MASGLRCGSPDAGTGRTRPAASTRGVSPPRIGRASGGSRSLGDVVISPNALDREAHRALETVGRTLGLRTWPRIPITWNRRLRRAGRALIDHVGADVGAARIELSPVYFRVYPEDLAGILVHEAVHVGLALQGRPFGHGAEFRRACRASGGLLHSRWLPGRVFRYRCPPCGEVYERRRRAAGSRWCADCVAAAEAARVDPYAPERALRLVETVFRGPELPESAARSVCEPTAGDRTAASDCTPSEGPLRYPVEHSKDDPPSCGGP